MIVSYRMNGAPSKPLMLQGVEDMQLAFNRVVQRLGKQAPAEIGRFVRYEGRVKIGRKSFPAISQGGLIVVKGGPTIPDKIELRV